MKRCNNQMCTVKVRDLKFGKRNNTPDGLKILCEVCERGRRESYKKTKRGAIAQIFSFQVSESKRRNLTPPLYTEKELYKWIDNNHKELYYDLYYEWKDSSYDKDLEPAIKRKNKKMKYSFNNIELTTLQNIKGKNKMKTTPEQQVALELELMKEDIAVSDKQQMQDDNDDALMDLYFKAMKDLVIVFPTVKIDYDLEIFMKNFRSEDAYVITVREICSNAITHLYNLEQESI